MELELEEKESMMLPESVRKCIIAANIMAILYVLGCINIYLWRERILTRYMQIPELEQLAEQARFPISTIVEILVIVGISIYMTILIVKGKRSRIDRLTLGVSSGVIIGVLTLQVIMGRMLISYEMAKVSLTQGVTEMTAISCMGSAVSSIQFLTVISSLLWLFGIGIWYGAILENRGTEICRESR